MDESNEVGHQVAFFEKRRGGGACLTNSGSLWAEITSYGSTSHGKTRRDVARVGSGGSGRSKGGCKPVFCYSSDRRVGHRRFVQIEHQSCDARGLV